MPDRRDYWRGDERQRLYRLARLQRQFRHVSRRAGLYRQPRRRLRPGILALALAGCAGAYLLASPWPLDVALRDLAAFPNCAAARSVGLAPARRGEPGYWPRHDADNDGIACE